MKTEPDMGGVNLDILSLTALFLQARAPGDHAVGARINRRRRDGNRLGQPAHPFGGWRLVLLSCEKLPDGADITCAGRRKGASQRNHHANGSRDLSSDLTCDDAATAPADEADLQARILSELLDLRVHRRKVGVRRAHVATTAPAMDLIAEAFEKTTDSDS